MDRELTGALEENVLALLCYSDRYAAQVAALISTDLFSERVYRRIAERAVDHLSRYSKPPQIHIRDAFEAEIARKDADADFLERTFASMEEVHEQLQPEAVVDQVRRFIAIRQMSMAIDSASTALHRGDYEEARSALFQIDAAPLAQQGVWLRDTKAWLSFLNKNDAQKFSCGIDTLDEGGIWLDRGEMLMFVAATGKGKSWYLIEVGKRALRKRKKVLHVSLENNLEQCQERWTQSMLGMSNTEVSTHRVSMFQRNKWGQLTNVEPTAISSKSVGSVSQETLAEKLREWQDRGGALRVDWFPAGMLSVAQLNAHMEALARTENFVPDVVLLDYVDQMNISSANLRVETGRIVRELRGLAGTRKFALFTATQGNRYSADARLVTTSMVAEDWTKIGTSDVVLTYSQTQDEFEKGIARILVAKARNAKDKWIAWITQSYATGQFCLDSVYFNALTSGEIRRYVSPEGEDDS